MGCAENGLEMSIEEPAQRSSYLAVTGENRGQKRKSPGQGPGLKSLDAVIT